MSHVESETLSGELANCPFCGSKASPTVMDDGKFHRVECFTCPADMAGTDRDDAIKNWNRRALRSSGEAVAPEGWVMVPKVPTPEMVEALEKCEAYCDSCHGTAFSGWNGYAAMLSASPTPPASIQAVEAERDEARVLCEEFLNGGRAVLPQSKKHAEDLYTVAVACLKTYGIDTEAALQTAEAALKAEKLLSRGDWASQREVDLYVIENAALKADRDKLAKALEDETEACAKVADSWTKTERDMEGRATDAAARLQHALMADFGADIASAIRSRPSTQGRG